MPRSAIAFALATITVLCGMSPPSGRPPIGPLRSVEPKLYDLNFSVVLRAPVRTDQPTQDHYNLEHTPIVMPILFLGTYNRVDSESVAAQLWLDNRSARPALELKSGYPYGLTLGILNIERFNGQEIRWQIGYRVQVWSSQINDEDAAKVPWPEEWPKEVKDGLQPQMYVESNDPIFKDAVEQCSQGRLRSVAPYIAAKELVRYCIAQLNVSGDGTDRGNYNTLRGMTMVGAREAAAKGLGSPHDLVCVCVAMLRAAGIPARPVVGVEEGKSGQPTFVSWGEFYLPEAGWIPFDPMAMRGKAVRTMDVRKPWPEFGTLEDLNLRLPLAYHFIPPATVESPRSPAVWAWDPRPSRDITDFHQVLITITSRGKGVEDPQ